MLALNENDWRPSEVRRSISFRWPGRTEARGGERTSWITVGLAGLASRLPMSAPELLIGLVDEA